MSSHPNAPFPGGQGLSNSAVPQAYPQGAQVDPWAQTWIRPVGAPVGPFRPAMPGWPGPGFPPMPPPRKPRPRWALIGGVTAAVALVTAGTGVLIVVADRSDGSSDTTTVSAPASAPPTSATTTGAPAPPAVVAIDALPGLLLDPATVNGVEGTSGLVVRPDPNAGSGSGFADLPSNRPECQGVQHPGMVSALQGSGWIAAQTQVLSEPTDDWKHLVSNAVVDFPSAQLAGDYAAKQAQAWANCAGKSLTTNAAGEGPVTWSVGPTSNRNGTVSIVLTQEGAAGWACQRALTARNNIVVDARSCGFNRTDQAVTIASRIADRVHTPDQ